MLGLIMACGVQFPDQVLNSRPLYWECWVLVTGPPGKSLLFIFILALLGFCCRPSSVAASEGYSLVTTCRLLIASFFHCKARALEHWLSSCGVWALLSLSTRNLPRPGMEPMSPALAGHPLPLSHQGSPVDFIFKPKQRLTETHRDTCMFVMLTKK